jgi:integrase
VLSLEEVARLINAAGNLPQRALLMTLYGTGMRRTEVSLLKVSDINSQRMMIHVERGKTAYSLKCIPRIPCGWLAIRGSFLSSGDSSDTRLRPRTTERVFENRRARIYPEFGLNASLGRPTLDLTHHFIKS